MLNTILRITVTRGCPILDLKVCAHQVVAPHQLKLVHLFMEMDMFKVCAPISYKEKYPRHGASSSPGIMGTIQSSQSWHPNKDLEHRVPFNNKCVKAKIQ